MAVNAKSAKAIIKQKIEEGTARSLSHNTQGLPGRDTSSININTIAEKLKSVNNENRHDLQPTGMARKRHGL